MTDYTIEEGSPLRSDYISETVTRSQFLKIAAESLIQEIPCTLHRSRGQAVKPMTRAGRHFQPYLALLQATPQNGRLPTRKASWYTE
jgi:hypothetical protein